MVDVLWALRDAELFIGHAARLVLTGIDLRCKWGADGFVCFPSPDQIALDVGLSKRTIPDAITTLVEGGFIKVYFRQRQRYLWVNVGMILKLAKEKRQQRDREAEAKKAAHAPALGSSLPKEYEGAFSAMVDGVDEPSQMVAEPSQIERAVEEKPEAPVYSDSYDDEDLNPQLTPEELEDLGY